MFFDRLVRNIFIFFFVIIISINIYIWSIALPFGSGKEGNFQYYGIYSFFKHFESMPRFDFFVENIQDVAKLVSTWDGWRIGLAIITLGISEIPRMLAVFIQLIIMVLVDIVRIFGWILGFIGERVDSPILQQGSVQ